MCKIEKAKWELRSFVVTPRAYDVLTHDDISNGLARHLGGDWGDVDEPGRAECDRCLRHGGTLVSIYRSAAGRKFWIITETDRSVTTVLMPEDY
jgi:hypothetical protein